MNNSGCQAGKSLIGNRLLQAAAGVAAECNRMLTLEGHHQGQELNLQDLRLEILRWDIGSMLRSQPRLS